MDETVAYPKDIQALRPLGLHYFRVPRKRWELMLTRVRQMGADAVSTLVPWSWHELRDNVFDLTGITHPTRDVPDFLETCQAMGFPVILRVSPYVGAGLLWGGVPGWLIREHPEIRALGSNSQPRCDPASGSTFPSAEHPTFLKYLERWYQELSSALASGGWPDGPVVALRVDHPGPDESEPPADGVPAHWDYNPHVIQVQWPIWLRQKYDGIDALNAAWQTNYHSVSDAEFPRQLASSENSPHPPTEDLRMDDATNFVAYAAAHAVETYTRLLREAGWTGPIVTDADALASMGLPHAVQVDPDPPQVGAGIRWAMDAPVRVDGSPRRRFWAMKAALLEMEEGVKPIEGGTLVTAPESHRFRLPRPASDYVVHRLLLDGGLVEATSRKRGDMLLLDYLAADELGDTDMVIILDDPSAPLTGFLREYLASLLMGRAHTLRTAGAMCQAVIEAFSEPTPPPGSQETQPPASSTEDLQAAERSLEEAQRAAQRAAASLGRLERLASAVRGELAPTASTLPNLSAFSPQELERLTPIRDACAHVAPILAEAARSLSVLCQTGETSGEGLTLELYRIAFDAAQDTTREAEPALADALARLRTDLVSGALPLVAWTLQDWLTRTCKAWPQLHNPRRGQSGGHAKM
jgi:hypothetical protein